MCSKWSDKNQIIQLTVHIVFDIFSWRPRLVLFICYMSNMIFKIEFIHLCTIISYIRLLQFCKMKKSIYAGLKLSRTQTWTIWRFMVDCPALLILCLRETSKNLISYWLFVVLGCDLLLNTVYCCFFFLSTSLTFCNAYNYEINIW